ncbi:MAG: hypothetical protein ACTS4Z_00155 [Candidatus Hodgkinia cicadicola]
MVAVHYLVPCWTAESFIKELELSTLIKSDRLWHLTCEAHINLTWLMSPSLKNNNVLIDLPELRIKLVETKLLSVEIIECCNVNNVTRNGDCVVGVELTDGSKLTGRHVS